MKRKNMIAILLALAICFTMALTACKDEAPEGEQNASEGGGTSNKSGSGNNVGGNQQGKSVLGRADMESWLGARLSAIGGPSSISLFDGMSFDHTEDGFIFAGDFWTVKGVTASFEEIESSLNSQLSASGFKTQTTLLGVKWYINAGSEQMGFTLQLDSETKEVTVFMTHATANYTQEYISEQEAKMPDIIAGSSAIEKMPENFKITYGNENIKKTVICKDGSWYFKDYFSEYDSWSTTVYLLQSDNSYLIYTNSKSGPTYREGGTADRSELDEQIDQYFDKDGQQSNGSPSTYLQICKEYQDKEEDLFDSPNRYFDFSSSLKKTGVATVAGISCTVCATDDIWTDYEFSYDAQTGVLFKLKKTEYEQETVIFEIYEYDAAPTSLGDFVAP